MPKALHGTQVNAIFISGNIQSYEVNVFPSSIYVKKGKTNKIHVHI